MNMKVPKLFFSHSEKDKALVTQLIEAARIGLNLNDGDILCTSLPGYMPRAGDDILETIRIGGANSNSFIAVITPNSVKSTWVLFELGVRYASNNHFMIILANGATAKEIHPALRYKVLTQCTESELENLFNDIADDLEKKFKAASVKTHLKNAEILSRAEMQRNKDEVNKIRAVLELPHASSKIKIIHPEENEIIRREYLYEIELFKEPKENHSLWLAHEISGRLWLKEKLTFKTDVAKGMGDEGGNPPNGAWNLIVVEVDEKGESEIQSWFQQGEETGNYPGLKRLNGVCVADLKVILSKD